MKISGQAVLLRVFVGESDKLGHLPLYEAIVKQAEKLPYIAPGFTTEVAVGAE